MLELQRPRAGFGALADVNMTGMGTDNDRTIRAKRNVLFVSLCTLNLYELDEP